MKRSLLINGLVFAALLFFLTGCSKGYQVRFTNYYMEPMDSLIVGDTKVIFKNVESHVTTDYQKVTRGKHSLVFITKTKKRIYGVMEISSQGTGKRTIQIDAINQISILED